MQTPQTDIELLGLDALEQAAGCLKTVAHPHRLRMLQLLLHGEYTVGQLAKACEIPSSGASEHLGKMRDRGLLTNRREGRQIYYSVAEPGLAHILECIENRFG
ncbi:MAG: metalloregulator ArsR/SmtB family transcription factor [Phycisphaerales bacterium]|jgi:DNA-binding transcriptional ArsR family regulator|nr:metalloregulator ArsR/SmtB family transcription factor [Phycisphaerales bacterium]